MAQLLLVLLFLGRGDLFFPNTSWGITYWFVGMGDENADSLSRVCVCVYVSVSVHTHIYVRACVCMNARMQVYT